MKENLMRFRKVGVALFCAAMMAVSAGAVDSTMEDVQAALGTGFTGVATQALNVIAVIVPIALGIVAAIFIVRRSISWFKSLSK